ncbi:MAG TPA: ABC transporter permease [Usitatibacter sp.]|nr:ABC transporter permease [Usitatibacter sp.]
MASEKGARLRGLALVLPALLLVAAFLLAPLVLVIRYSLDLYDPTQLVKGVFSAQNYVQIFHDPFYTGVLLFTAEVAALSTLICLVLGYPVAYFISRSPSERLRSLLIIITVLPLLMGNAVRAAAWMVIMGTKGLANAMLVATHVVAEPVKLLYTPTAVVIGLVSVLLPFTIITLQSVLDAIPTTLEEAGRSLGFSPLHTMFAVVMPLSLPGLLAAGAICFCLAMNAYATPVLIGGPSVHMMGPLVYQQISKVTNWPFGSALACVLMAVTLTMTVISTTVLSRRYF